MGFVKTIKNIWTIEELRKRLLATLLLVLVYRLGCYIVLPGISPSDLDALSKFTSSSGLMQLLDMFSGGAFSQASIFALGIMPYITASIVIQLLGMVLPSFQKMQREGESGRQKLNQYTRYLTVLILLLQGPAYLVNLQVQVSQAGGAISMGFWTIAYLTIILAAGSMFIMWLGERITDRGIGNGISFIILVGIIARLPGAIFYEFTSRLPGASGSEGGLVMFIVELLLLFAVTVGAVLLVQGTRKVPVQYAKRIVGNRQYGGARQYIPLKVNAAGVMPIIFAQAIMFIPITLAGFGTNEGSSGFFRTFADVNGFWYNLVYFVMIVAFTYFYTAITVRPNDMAENLKRNNGFIPGVKPGKKTAEYLDQIMSRITLPGSLFLGVVAILPAFARVFGISQNFSQFFGGTSLLILVGVVLDTLTQIESHLMMHHYDGLMKEGKIKGRTTARWLIEFDRGTDDLSEDSDEMEKMRRACDLVSQVMGEVAKQVAPGVTTRHLDSVAREYMLAHGGKPACLGYGGFPGTLCIEVNETVVHGFPSGYCLREGDIVGIDTVVELDGFNGDMCYTFMVGDVADDVRRLCVETKNSLYKGIEACKPGNRIGDISNAVQTYVERRGYTVVREMCGHGIGKKMHEDPEVPNYGRRGTGPLIKNGMCLCIEPMINLGSKNVVIESDGWTCRTRDRKPSAHYEHTLAVHDGATEVLTTFDYIAEALGDRFI